MSLTWRRRIRLGRSSWLNLSRRGVSASKRIGRATVSTTGRVSVRLGKGLSWRGRL